MAFLGLKKNKEKKGAAPLPVETKKAAVRTARDLSGVIVGPRMTEKAALMNETRTYVFEVAQAARAKDVAKAVEELYKVKPTRVSMVRIPRKRVFVRGKFGTKKGGKKAYVQLKEGDKIEVI